MEDKKPRRISSLVLGLLIVFSAFTVLNFVSMNVLADDPPDWDPGHNVTGMEWYENCNIRMLNGNLTIFNGGTLTFNDSVTFQIINSQQYPHKYGIIIEDGGKFIINSSGGNTEILSGSTPITNTYPFLNSGTIDFLGANVTRVYGDSDDPDTTGGIRNLPGSNCTLENCNIMDGDTHGVYVEGNETMAEPGWTEHTRQVNWLTADMLSQDSQTRSGQADGMPGC